MFRNFAKLFSAVLVACAVTVSCAALGDASSEGNGVVVVDSAYSVDETVARVKKDIADKGIMFFMDVDQAKLAAGAKIALRPSHLLIFGNPPLGIQFLTSNPVSGLDWPVRLLVFQDADGKREDGLQRLHLGCASPRDHRPRRAVQDGDDGDYVDHLGGALAGRRPDREKSGSGAWLRHSTRSSSAPASPGRRSRSA